VSDLEQEIAALDALSSGDLRQRWATLTGSPVPRISPALLRLALAWELQARRLGGYTREVTRQLDQLARGVTRTSRSQPGMRLVREWQGRVDVVTIDEDQTINWDDRSWRSLSEVAREITGTRWSGPAFFGLKKKVAA
jgi:predicted component of type VI protein secretion system